MNRATVTVVMSTYNHGDLVAEAVHSVLRQRDVDLEFLVADDGSVDDTREVVAACRDPRLKFLPYEENRGACAVLNELIGRASGEFVAVINSDDYWTVDDKLAYQVDVLRQSPSVGACFGRARFVDRAGRSMDKASLAHGHVFDKENRSSGAWLRHFFTRGNCLCHPTMLIRKACYDAVGLYDNRLRQLPDFDMWIRLVKRYEIHITERELIAFRQLPGENASSDTPANLRRLLNETYFILRRFFMDVPRDSFLEGFGDLLVTDDPSEAELQIEQAILFLDEDRWSPQIFGLIGLEMVHDLLQREPHKSLLAKEYGIDDLAFHSLASKVAPFFPSAPVSPLTSERGRALAAELRRRAMWRSSRAAHSMLNKVMRGKRSLR